MAKSLETTGEKLNKRNFKTPNELLHIANKINVQKCDFDLVDSKVAASVIPQVFKKFTITHNTNVSWIWEYLNTGGTGLRTDKALEIIQPLFCKEAEVWLLVEDKCSEKEAGNFWLFKGKYLAILDTLMNYWSLEYYIMDLHLSWMLFENHHEFLGAIGEPAESLLKKRLAELDLCS